MERRVSPCRRYNAASAFSSRSVIAPISASSVAELKPSVVNVGAIINFKRVAETARYRRYRAHCSNRAHATSLLRFSRSDVDNADEPTDEPAIDNEESG